MPCLVANLGLAALVLPLAACGGVSRESAAQGSGGNGSATAGDGGSARAGDGGAAEPASGSGGMAPQMPIDSFETSDFLSGPGLWMGFDGEQLPTAEPPVPHDGAALHLVGKTDDAGLDVFFHTGLPVERIWSSVRFWSQSDVPGAAFKVAIAGPVPQFFQDRAQGIAWPLQVVEPGRAWRETVVDFAELGVGPEMLSPHSEMFGAVHFIVEPHTSYDFWIDDFGGQPLYR